jgi:carbonic anhydrase/acetyltransferase-like protein (isoleucine patch superfamily)
MARLFPLDGVFPRIDESAFVADNATIIGDVIVGPEASVWFGCVLRADVGSIRVGARSNIQDLSMIHMTEGHSVTAVGEDVTVGHGVILHGCTIHDRVLVGMGSIVLDNVVVGEGSVIGAGSLVTQGTIVPPRSLAMGRPATIKREVNEREGRLGIDGARHYVEAGRRYSRQLR